MKYKRKQITGFELAKVTSESLFIAATTTVGSIIGAAIPIPVLGSIIGAVGGLVGKL